MYNPFDNAVARREACRIESVTWKGWAFLAIYCVCKCRLIMLAESACLMWILVDIISLQMRYFQLLTLFPLIINTALLSIALYKITWPFTDLYEQEGSGTLIRGPIVLSSNVLFTLLFIYEEPVYPPRIYRIVFLTIILAIIYVLNAVLWNLLERTYQIGGTHQVTNDEEVEMSNITTGTQHDGSGAE